SGPGCADRVEQQPHAVEIDAVAPLEIGLRLAGENGRQVEDDLGTARDEGGGHPGLGEVGADGLDLEARPDRPRRLYQVGEHGVRDPRAPEQPVARDPLQELPTDHPRRTGDQDPHAVERSARGPGMRCTMSPGRPESLHPERFPRRREVTSMTKVLAAITTSVDGYITGPDDRPGE